MSISINTLSAQLTKELKVMRSDFIIEDKNDKERLKAIRTELANLTLSFSNNESAKAFWLNIYNAFTSILILEREIKGSMMKNPAVFFMPKIKIARHSYSLDDIEHGILRTNKRAPYKPFKQFCFYNPRKKNSLKTLDYRVHFAMNCGALSCPPLASYSSENIDSELDLAEQAFAEQEFKVDDSKKEITCSMIYKSFKSDFHNVYLNDIKYQRYKVIVKKYNWQVG